MAKTKRIPRCTTYGRKPRTALAALKQARQFLIDEGKDHWCKGQAFTPNKRNGTGRVKNPDEALCGNWGVCAIGAVQLVGQGFTYEFDSWANEWYESDVFNKVVSMATVALNEAVSDSCSHDFVWELNDAKRTKRADVIRVFDKAIENLGGK